MLTVKSDSGLAKTTIDLCEEQLDKNLNTQLKLSDLISEICAEKQNTTPDLCLLDLG